MFGQRGPRRWFTAASLAAAVALALTLRADPGQVGAAEATPWQCLACGPAGGADLIQNLILFLPFGLALAGAGLGGIPVATACLGLSLGIELAQAYLVLGRDAALGDVVANTLGGTLGWAAWRTRAAWLLPTGRRAAWSAGAVVALFVMQLVAAPWLAVPTVGGITTLRIAPTVPARPTYAGVVSDLALAGMPLIESARPLGERPPDGATFEASFTWDPADGERLVPILRVEDPRGWVIAALDAEGQGVCVEIRSRAHHLRLRPQAWIVALPRGTQPGDPLHIAVTVASGQLIGELRSPAGRTEMSLPYGAQHGWTLLNPFARRHAGGAAWLGWTLAWLAGWGVLLGWVGAGTRRPAAWLAASAAGLLTLSAAAHARASTLEMLALVVGWCLAYLSSARCRRSAGGS